MSSIGTSAVDQTGRQRSVFAAIELERQREYGSTKNHEAEYSALPMIRSHTAKSQMWCVISTML